MPAPGRFPLHPGRPLVFRRPNGRWGYSCTCAGHVSAARASGLTASERHNCDDWTHALREARDHVAFWHKTRVELETEHLERLYALPAAR
jgi:hypothetical protein